MKLLNGNLFIGKDKYGIPISYGKVYIRHSDTGLPANSWKNKNKTEINPYPILLDDKGMANIYIDAGVYNITILNSNYDLVREITHYIHTDFYSLDVLNEKKLVSPRDSIVILDSDNNAETKIVQVEDFQNNIESKKIILNLEVQYNVKRGDVLSFYGDKASSYNTKYRDRIAGIVLEDCIAGRAARIINYGIFEGNFNFSPNSILYLNGENISQISPNNGFIQEIGVSLSNYKIMISIKKSIKL